MNKIAVYSFLFLLLVLAGCGNEDDYFHLKTIRLNEYEHVTDSPERLHLEVYEDLDAESIAYTETYPSDQTLPALFKVYPSTKFRLYHEPIYLKLIGDSSGTIASFRVNMDDYKIIYPIDMEVESEQASIAILGSWD